MDAPDVFADAFTRIKDIVHRTVDGLGPEDLSFRADPDANSIAWLIWHLTRVQDDHIAEVADIEQVWTAGGWVEKFNLPFDPVDHGFGHSSEQVGAVKVSSGDLLTGYHDAVYAQTISYLEGLENADLDRVVDESWDPPVTLGVRLVSVISDDLQHAGQASLVRGIRERTTP